MWNFRETTVPFWQATCLLLFITGSIFSVGYHQFDEHCQILEFAAWKLGTKSGEQMPWEFYEYMRPAVQPVMVYLLSRLLSLFGADNPFFLAFILRLISALFAFFIVKQVYKTYADKITDPLLRRLTLILSFTVWFTFYIGVRFSSENWSGLCFTAGICYYLREGPQDIRRHLITAMLMGLSFLFRYQAAFLIVGFFAWLVVIRKAQLGQLIVFVSAGLLLLLAGFLTDYWFYGKPVLTFWNYYEQNISQNRSASFGVDPWWWYLTKITESGIPPLSLAILTAFAILLLFQRKNLLLWTILPFFIAHSAIGHKEIRFLFPLSYLVPALIMEGMAIIQDRFHPLIHQGNRIKIGVKIMLIVNVLAIPVAVLKPADNHIYLYKKIYHQYPEPITLYFTDDNPYRRTIDIAFYKRENLTIDTTGVPESIPAGKKILVVTGIENRHKFTETGKLVYQSLPDWIHHFNINHWVERSRIWYVFELNGPIKINHATHPES